MHSNSKPLTRETTPQQQAITAVNQLVQLVLSKLENNSSGASVAVENIIEDFMFAVNDSTSIDIRPTLAGHFMEFQLLHHWVSDDFQCVCGSAGKFSEPANDTQSFCDFFCSKCLHQHETKSTPTASAQGMMGGSKQAHATRFSIINSIAWQKVTRMGTCMNKTTEETDRPVTISLVLLQKTFLRIWSVPTRLW